MTSGRISGILAVDKKEQHSAASSLFTLSEGSAGCVQGEQRSVEGEPTVGASSQLTLLVPNVASPYFWRPSADSWCVAMVESPVSHLESTVPTAVCEMATVFGSAGCVYFTCRVLSVRPPSPSSATSSAPPWQERRYRRRADRSRQSE